MDPDDRTLDYAAAPARFRVSRRGWVVLAITAATSPVGLTHDHWRTETSIDLDSGDVLYQTWVGPVELRHHVEQTAFSRAVRQYAGARRPASWTAIRRWWSGHAAEDIANGTTPAECDMPMSVLDTFPGSEADRRTTVVHCAHDLAANDRDGLEGEIKRLLDGAGRPATRP